MNLPTPPKPGRRPDRPAGTRPLVLGNLTLAVGRAMGTVVVTVKGTVGEEGRQLLEGVLTVFIPVAWVPVFEYLIFLVMLQLRPAGLLGSRA